MEGPRELVEESGRPSLTGRKRWWCSSPPHRAGGGAEGQEKERWRAGLLRRGQVTAGRQDRRRRMLRSLAPTAGLAVRHGDCGRHWGRSGTDGGKSRAGGAIPEHMVLGRVGPRRASLLGACDSYRYQLVWYRRVRLHRACVAAGRCTSGVRVARACPPLVQSAGKFKVSCTACSVDCGARSECQ